MRRRTVIIIVCMAASFIGLAWRYSIPPTVYRFENLAGPAAPTVIPPPVAANWRQYSEGSDGRLAILLTDPNSNWLALAHGLKSIGVPIIITDDYQRALRHKVVESVNQSWIIRA